MRDFSNIPQSGAAGRATTMDAGLRTHFQRIYNTMSIGLVVTALMAFVVANVEPLRNVIFGTPLKFVAIFAPMAFVWFGFSPSRVQRMNVSQLAGMFYGFSAVFGVSMATIFMAYSGEGIARTFFVTAGMFAATSLFGYTTKKDLTGMGSLMIMGAIGIFIAMIVNMFLHSAMVQYVVSVIGVIVYTGLIAWDTQNLKEMYRASNGDEANGKMAVMGALSLYLDFVNLFLMLIRLLGDRR